MGAHLLFHIARFFAKDYARSIGLLIVNPVPASFIFAIEYVICSVLNFVMAEGFFRLALQVGIGLWLGHLIIHLEPYEGLLVDTISEKHPRVGAAVYYLLFAYTICISFAVTAVVAFFLVAGPFTTFEKVLWFGIIPGMVALGVSMRRLHAHPTLRHPRQRRMMA